MEYLKNFKEHPGLILTGVALSGIGFLAYKKKGGVNFSVGESSANFQAGAESGARADANYSEASDGGVVETRVSLGDGHRHASAIGAKAIGHGSRVSATIDDDVSAKMPRSSRS
jgi:hypothetical protein